MKYFLHSLGCKVNSYELSAIGTELSSHGYSPCENAQDADVIIINTCSVTGRADQKSRQHISSYRKGNPNAIIVVMGCYSQKHGEEAESLGANLVFGSADRSKIYEAIETFLKTKINCIDIKSNVRKETYEELGFSAFCDNARAYLKVQDGCNNFCSYCLIPFLRGNSRSRDPRMVIDEAKKLVSNGYKEIVITGIHIGAYGLDLGEGSFRLPQLIESILVACPSLPRIRISSIEESEIQDDFLDLLARYPQVVDHLHIPLQSGSATVLQRMKRKYDTASFLSKLVAIRRIRPQIAITTDVIAGFPQENDEEWQETMNFCRQADFAEIHVFPFSSRPGTLAHALPDVDPKIKKARVHQLLDLSRELRENYKKRFFNQDLPVLFEEFDPKSGYAYGHTSNYLLVKIKSEKPLHGKMLLVTYNNETASD